MGHDDVFKLTTDDGVSVSLTEESLGLFRRCLARQSFHAATAQTALSRAWQVGWGSELASQRQSTGEVFERIFPQSPFVHEVLASARGGAVMVCWHKLQC